MIIDQTVIFQNIDKSLLNKKLSEKKETMKTFRINLK